MIKDIIMILLLIAAVLTFIDIVVMLFFGTYAIIIKLKNKKRDELQ